MALDFPSSPTVGQIYQGWTWNGTAWDAAPRSGSIINQQIFTASGTYTPTSGMRMCMIEGVGGGGGGGGTNGGVGLQLAAGGGGSGGYSRKLATAAQIGASQTVTIGAAGIAGIAATPTSGGNGGATSLGSLCIANGGIGGPATVNGVNPPAAALGGAPGTGDLVAAGAPGGAGFYGNATYSGGYSGGFGGSSFFGGGAPGPANATGPGIAARNYGSGGSGGSSNASGAGAAGAAGSAGLVIITEYA